MRALLLLAALLVAPVAAHAAATAYPQDYSTIPPYTVIGNQSPFSDNPVPLSLGMVSTRSAITANDTTATAVSIPANAVLRAIYIRNTTANAVTGGINIGTTAAGSDVVSAFAVAGNGLLVINPGATLLKQYFSATASQQLFISAVTAWNSASLIVRFEFDQ